MPAAAADSASGSASKAGQSESAASDTPDGKEAASPAAEGAESDQPAQEKPEPGVYSCAYYTVRLPEGWRAVLVPEERQGNVNAIFASANDQAIITPIVGPRGGADAATIAEMFAEQFKAQSPPVERYGQYFFSFEQTDAATGHSKKVDACVSTQGGQFMVTTWTGDQAQVRDFLTKSMTSDNYPDLLPRIGDEAADPASGEQAASSEPAAHGEAAASTQDTQDGNVREKDASSARAADNEEPAKGDQPSDGQDEEKPGSRKTE